MTATSHRIFNLSAGIALSFHWWVWLLFLLAASLPDQLEPATRRQSRFRSHRGYVPYVLSLDLIGSDNLLDTDIASDG